METQDSNTTSTECQILDNIMIASDIHKEW